MALIEKLTAMKYAAKISKLVDEKITNDNLFLYLKANTLQDKAARDVFCGRLGRDTYAKLFKIKESDASHHFLDLWAEEVRTQKN